MGAKTDSEAIFDRFVSGFGGQRISDLLPGDPKFENADYLFREANVIAELKTLSKDFGATAEFSEKHFQLTKEYLADGRMTFGSIFRPEEHPRKYVLDFLRIFRPSLGRLLKKANLQLKQTKVALHLPKAAGILLVVNDKFLSLEPRFIIGLMSGMLVHSYSSIDAYVYLTLNHYVEIPESDYAHLLWTPVYSERAPDSLRAFIDTLGDDWFKFLDREIGPFDDWIKSDDLSVVASARPIRRPFGVDEN